MGLSRSLGVYSAPALGVPAFLLPPESVSVYLGHDLPAFPEAVQVLAISEIFLWLARCR